MATEPLRNGAAISSSSSSPDFAGRLLQKHAPVNGHGPMIEDAVDEEDILHPPPSVHHNMNSNETASGPVLVAASETLSEKAKGKQAVQQDSFPKAAPTAGLDTKSEELFPALGGGPKPRAQGPVTTAWGSKKPSSVANGKINGTNGHDAPSGAASSRPSTPASGILTPASTNFSNRVSIPQHMSMPGRHSETVKFAPSQLLPRNELKKPLVDVLRDINKRSKATVEVRPGPGGVMYFEGKGPVDAVRQALKDVAKEVGSRVRSGIA